MVDMPRDLAREAFMLLAMTGAPFMLTVLVAGLIMGVLQAATQVNDPAVGFLPRAVVGIGVAYAFGPLAVEKLAAFFTMAVNRMGGGP